MFFTRYFIGNLVLLICDFNAETLRCGMELLWTYTIGLDTFFLTLVIGSQKQPVRLMLSHTTVPNKMGNFFCSVTAYVN